jgi:NADPH-dependent glutamate synthase beta subunit-like oxidoreductase
MRRAHVRDLWWFRRNVPCLEACPVKTDAGRYVQLIADGRFAEAYRVARAPNPIASICGRSCGAPCEDACRRGKIDAPVAIRSLKRFVCEGFGPESLSATSLAQVLRGDMAGGSTTPGHGPAIDRARRPAGTGRRVAVVGAGPAGLACAHDLAVMGHRVTVFEALPHPGGMMRYGIPAYRLPREVIDFQTAEIESLGVEFRFNHPLTRGDGIGRLRKDGFEAVFLAVGAGSGRGIGIEGIDLDGVVKAIDYLLNINRGYRLPLGKRIVVVGGGLVALDAARVAMRAILPGITMDSEEEVAFSSGPLRLALDSAREAARREAADVVVTSLESLTDLPAGRTVQGREEIDLAREEGIRFLPSWGPHRIVGEKGKVSGIELVRCTRVFDEQGRFAPTFDSNERRVLETDGVILAIGQAPDTSFLRPDDGVEVTPAGTVHIDPATLATTAPGIFAGGDSAFPPALLITAAAQGKLAARSIDGYLNKRSSAATKLHVAIEELPTDTYRMSESYERIERRISLTPLERRSGITEVETCMSAAEAQDQAKRCLFCHIHPIYDGERCILCARCADICPEDCIQFVGIESLEIADAAAITADQSASGEGTRTAFLYDEEKCIRCGLCAIRCPTSAITMERFHFEESASDG